MLPKIILNILYNHKSSPDFLAVALKIIHSNENS